jgi:TusA-related sulfurtransferase
MSSPKPDRTLDAKGLLCPEPVLKTNEAIRSIEVGQILEVQATDPAAKSDITVWAKRTGQELLSVYERGELVTFLLRRTK